MTTPGGLEALAVIRRTAGWLRRNADRARFAEGSLQIWMRRAIESAPDAAGEDAANLFGAIEGFDAALEVERRDRAARMIEAVDRMLAVMAAPSPIASAAGDGGDAASGGTGSPRAVLLPEGIASDLPPRPALAMPPAAAAGAGRDVAAPAPVRSDRDARPVSGDDRPARGDDRPGRRGRHDGRGTRGQAAMERGPAAVPEEGAEGTEGAPGGARAETTEDRQPAPPRVVEPPPPPPCYPLGHPEGTGAPVASLGATPAEVAALAAVDVATVADLLLLRPRSLERGGERIIDGVSPEGPVLVRGKVLRRATRHWPGIRRHEIVLQSDRQSLRCRWLGEVPSEVTRAVPGAALGLVGRYETDDDGALLYEGEPLGVDGRGGDFLPHYGVPDLPDARARALLRQAIRSAEGTLLDHLPAEVVERHKLPPLASALRDAHFPSNMHRSSRARFAFDELLQIQLGMALLRAPERRDRGSSHAVSHTLVSRALALAGWSFNDPQESAYDTLRRDLRRNAAMERLLQGDVGSGKGAVIRAAMTVVAEGKGQVLFVASSASSAEHNHLFAAEWFRSVGIEALLLLGDPTRAQAEALKKGDTLVVYGTRRLLEKPPECRRIGLLVVEQNGTYGVPDLSALTERGGARPDLLVTTPTPVPALLAMTVYGQLAMTVVPSPPTHGVETVVTPPEGRDDAYVAAREALAEKRQVILVFPSQVSPSEARRITEVLGAADGPLPAARFSIFSQGLSPQERFRAYDDFQHRRSDVLFATAEFEDGPIVPNASVMIVEYADTWDLVRLHRLRNHVANGWVRARCFLVQRDDATQEGIAAVRMVAEEGDGFRIADLDLARRGLEAALGPDAADVPRFLWADPAQDRDTLLRARQEAFRLLALDPGLRRRAHRALLNVVRARFGEEPLPPEAALSAAPAAADEATVGARRRRRRRR